MTAPPPDDAEAGWQSLAAHHRLPPDASLPPQPDDALDAFAYAPLPSDQDEGLQSSDKLPRRLHLWFALALGGLAFAAVGVQQFAPGWRSLAPAPRSDRPPPAEAEPPLAALQSELARQKGQGTAGTRSAFARPSLTAPVTTPSASPRWPASAGPADQRPPAAAAWLDARAAEATLAGAAPVPAPRDLEPLRQVPAGLLEAPAGAAAATGDADRSAALIAGSRILAIGHGGGLEHALSPEVGAALRGAGRDPAHQLAELLQAAPELISSLPRVVGAALQPGTRAGGAAAGDVPPTPPAGAGGTAAPSPALRLQPAAADTLILEGTPLPCLLLTEVRSDLPGMIVAQLAEDVFDSVTAQRKLIPRGTRLIGRYESQVAQGQQRLFAAFHRMILPGGASMELPGMQASDAAGSAGLQDEVDTHFWQRFGQAFLTAGLARAAQRDVQAAGVGVQGGLLPGPDASGQILVETARGSLQSYAGRPPTLVIRRGTAFNVMVSRDLVLPELAGP